jgi:hypothetical protein
VARGWARTIAQIELRPQSEDRLLANAIGGESTRRALPEWAFDGGRECGEEWHSEDQRKKKRWGGNARG